MDLTAVALAAEVRAGRVTPQAAARAALVRIEALNPRLNAICALNPALMEEAASVAARLADGEDLPLAGVPVVIKDNIWVRGLTVTQGSRLFADFVAPEDAKAVALLRRAGALIVGMATCSEFACKGVTNTPLHGKTLNPVDPGRTPGGSSGGPAVAVAAGMVPLAIGTDAGGSSRRPPAHVGVVGFKPTQDLVPYGPGFDEPIWGISAICPIARDVADVRLALSALAEVPSGAPLVARIAASADYGLGQRLDHDMGQAFAGAMSALRDTGVEVVEASPDWQGLTGASVMPLQFAGLAALFGAVFAETPGVFDPDIAVQIEQGLALSGADVARAHHASHRMGEILRGFLSRHDAILVPTTPCAAWPVDRLAPETIGGEPCAPRDHAAFTPQANHAGCPAISIPCGKTAEGLPLGLQIVSAPGRDAALLDLAARIEAILRTRDVEEVSPCVSSF